MLRTGVVFLSTWSGLNLLLAVASLLAITVFHQNSPGLTLMVEQSEIHELGPRWLALINGLAALCNTFDAAFFILALCVIWTSLVRKARWAFWGLVISGGFLQVFAFASYSFIGTGIARENVVTLNLLGNLVSSGLLVVGLALSGYGIYGQR